MYKTQYQEIVEILKEKNITISTCESVTGGMIASFFASKDSWICSFFGMLSSCCLLYYLLLVEYDGKKIWSCGIP